jgi:hypothetical protein
MGYNTAALSPTGSRSPLLGNLRGSVQIVGYTSPTFLRKLNSTPNRESEKVVYGCAVIQELAADRGSVHFHEIPTTRSHGTLSCGRQSAPGTKLFVKQSLA